MMPMIPHSEDETLVWPALPGEQGRSILALLYQFEQTQWWSPDEIMEMQFRQLDVVLKHARATVPFHAARLQKLGLPRSDGLTIEDWQRLPILTRRDIQDAGDDLYSTDVPATHGRVSEIHSSGSTGRPVRALRTRLSLLMWSAFTMRDHLWQRRDLRGKFAAIRNSTPGRDSYPDGSRFRYWGSSNRAFDTGPAFSLNITCSMTEQADWLSRVNPDYLLTHPTNIHRLADHCKAHGIKLPNLKQVQVISEILRPETRLAVREAWGVEVTDLYSTREVGYIAIQCPDHEHYHVQSEGALVEIVDDRGRACKPGEVGRILVTPIHNFAMPMLRYEVGDFGELGEPCPCGRGLPVIKRILGREQNMLVLPNGEKRWTLLSDGNIRDFLAIAPIRQYQFVQKTTEIIELRLVVARKLKKAEEKKIVKWMTAKLETPYTVKFSYFDDIPRSKAGKFQDFISEVA